MSPSTVLSTFSSQAKVGKAKVSKNPGLSLCIAHSRSEQGDAVRSLANSDTNDGAQYIFIHSDSPFYKGIPPPRTPAYLSFTGFAFACDALSGEDLLLTKTPHELLDEELQHRMASSDRRSSKKPKMSKSVALSLNLTRELSCPSQRIIMRRRPGTANSFTNTPGLEPSSDADSDSDFESDEDAQFVYIPANSPFNTPASTARTASAYLPLSAIPFACDALAEEDPLFASSPSDLFDDEYQHSAGPLLDGEGSVVVVDLENTGGELLITRGWTQSSHPKPLSKGLENGHNVEARVSQQYM